MRDNSNLQELLVKKAWEDAEFKKALLENPKETIQKMLEIVIPNSINIKVVEETADTMYLVIPANPAENMSAAGSALDAATVYASPYATMYDSVTY